MTSEQKKRDFASVMDRLRANYLSNLPDKANQLAQTLADLQAGNTEAAASLAQQIHRLAGTAGSFGVQDVSDVANTLDARLHNGESPSEMTQELQSLIALLHERAITTEQ